MCAINHGCPAELARQRVAPTVPRSSDGARSGFSLVELVIVIVIIGIIAAIAVPRVSRGSKGASEAALRASLTVLHAAIDLYAAEHQHALPGADTQEQTFIDQLTQKTDAAGNVGTTSGVHVFGPYLCCIPALPVGPNVGARGVELKTNGNVYENKPTKGWMYNWETGHIYANTDDLDDRGVGYDTY